MSRPLTRRQDEVLRLVAEGCTNDEIAGQLSVGPATVQRHVEDIRTKLDARNRAHAVWCAVQAGFLEVAS